MKKIFLAVTFMITACLVYSQDADKEKKFQKIPSVNIKTLDGRTFNTSEITNNGKPVILSFWATWCKPCVNELTTIADVYDDWKEETGVKLVAVSIDDARTSSNVMSFVNGKSWDYEVLLDANGDFKRAMNVNVIPHTFVINGNGEIVWQHTSFSPGSELGLIGIVKKVIAGEPIPEE